MESHSLWSPDREKGMGKGTKAQGHKGTEWGEGITTDFTDEHGSRFAQWLRQDKLVLNLDRDLDLDPDRKIYDLEKKLDGDSEILSYRDAEREKN